MVDMEALCLTHGPSILRYLRRNFGRVGGEDLLQEVFVRALGRRREVLEAESPRAFLFGVARHVGLTALRRGKVRAMRALEDVAVAEEEKGIGEMREAIGRLPGQIRETLELRLREELSYEEIAVVLEIPVGTVRSRLHRALELLREALKEGA